MRIPGLDVPRESRLLVFIGLVDAIGTGLYIAGNTIVLLTLPEIRYHVQVRAQEAQQWIDAGTIGSRTIHPGFLFFLFGALATFDLLYLWLVYHPRPVGSG